MCLVDSNGLPFKSPLNTEIVEVHNGNNYDDDNYNDDDGDMMFGDVHSHRINRVQQHSVRLRTNLPDLSVIRQLPTSTSSLFTDGKRFLVCEEQCVKTNNHNNNSHLITCEQSNKFKQVSTKKKNLYNHPDYSRACLKYAPVDSNPDPVKTVNDLHFVNHPPASTSSSYRVLNPHSLSDSVIPMNTSLYSNVSTNFTDINNKYSNGNKQLRCTNFRGNKSQITRSVQLSCRANIMKRRTERKSRNKPPTLNLLMPSLLSESFSNHQIRTENGELNERRANQRKERSRLAAQIRRNREGQSLMLMQNALPISSRVLGLSLIHLKCDTSHYSIGINQSASRNNELQSGTVSNSQKKFYNSTAASSNPIITTLTTSTSTMTLPSTTSSTSAAINLEKTGVLRIAGHTLFLLNKLSSYLGVQMQLNLGLNSRSMYGMLIDSKEMRIAYATPALAEAVGWPWIKLLGAPLNKLIKFTETCQTSKEIPKKLLSKSYWPPSSSYPSFNEIMKTPTSGTLNSLFTVNTSISGDNDSSVDIEAPNEFILPQFVTLSRLISKEHQASSTTRSNKLDDTNITNSHSIPVNTKKINSTFTTTNDITSEFQPNKKSKSHHITKAHGIKNSYHHSVNDISNKNQHPLPTTVMSTRFQSSNTTVNTVGSSTDVTRNNSTIKKDENCTFNAYNWVKTESSSQKMWINPTRNDKELVCYCWISSMISARSECSNELSQFLETLGASGVSDNQVDDDQNNGVNDIRKCLLDNDLPVDAITDDTLLSNPLNFDSPWPASPSPSVTNTTSTSDSFFDNFDWISSTGLYLCLLQPIDRCISTYDSIVNPIDSAFNDTMSYAFTNNYNRSNDKNNELVGRKKISGTSLSKLSIDEENYDADEKMDCLLPSIPYESMTCSHTDETLLGPPNIALSSPSPSSASVISTSSEEKTDHIQPNFIPCLTYLNYALKIKAVQGNYKECFNGDEQSGIIGRSYLDFIHPDDLKQVTNVFDTITHSNSLGWISPCRISMIKQTVNTETEKSYRWVRSLVVYNEVDKIFVCFHRFLGLCESCTYAVSLNQELLCTNLENSFIQFQSDLNTDDHTTIELSQGVMDPLTCNTSYENSTNFHYRPRNKQLRVSNSSISSLRVRSCTMNKKSVSMSTNRVDHCKTIKSIPIQSIPPLKQRFPKGYGQIIYRDNQIKTITSPFCNNSSINMPNLPQLDNNLYNGKTNNNHGNPVLNSSAVKYSLHFDLPSAPYCVRSVIPVIGYKSLPSKQILFFSPTSSTSPSLSTSIVQHTVKKSQSLIPLISSRCKSCSNENSGKHIDNQAIYYQTIITSTNCNNSFSHSCMKNHYTKKIFITKSNELKNSSETTSKYTSNDHWKSSDNCSISADNSLRSPFYSEYSQDSRSTSDCVSQNEEIFTDFGGDIQMEATVSELLASIPSPCKLPTEDDRIMQIDLSSSLYDPDILQYDELSIHSLQDSNVEVEESPGFQPDLFNDSIISNSQQV